MNSSCGDLVSNQLIYYPLVTREEFRNRGRITHAFETGQLPDDIGLPEIDLSRDRFMLCGSPHMLADMTTWLKGHNFREGSNAHPGHFVIGKAFVER